MKFFSHRQIITLETTLYNTVNSYSELKRYEQASVASQKRPRLQFNNTTLPKNAEAHITFPTLSYTVFIFKFTFLKITFLDEYFLIVRATVALSALTAARKKDLQMESYPLGHPAV